MSWIGDVGALTSTLFQISSIILTGLFKLNILLDNFMLMSIFRIRNSRSLKTRRIKLSFLDYVKQLPYACCPKVLGLSKPTKYSHMYEVGMRRIEREIDLGYFIRKQILNDTLLRALTTKSHRALARRQQEFVLGDAKSTTTESSTDFDPNDFSDSVKKSFSKSS